jgi:hypothetical protein
MACGITMNMNMTHRLYNNQVYTRTVLEKFEFDLLLPEDATNKGTERWVEIWFESTEKGKWCKSNCMDIEAVSQPDHWNSTMRVAIIGYMKEKDHTFFLLKWRV